MVAEAPNFLPNFPYSNFTAPLPTRGHAHVWQIVKRYWTHGGIAAVHRRARREGRAGIAVARWASSMMRESASSPGCSPVSLLVLAPRRGPGRAHTALRTAPACASRLTTATHAVCSWRVHMKPKQRAAADGLQEHAHARARCQGRRRLRGAICAASISTVGDSPSVYHWLQWLRHDFIQNEVGIGVLIHLADHCNVVPTHDV